MKTTINSIKTMFLEINIISLNFLVEVLRCKVLKHFKYLLAPFYSVSVLGVVITLEKLRSFQEYSENIFVFFWNSLKHCLSQFIDYWLSKAFYFQIPL